MALGRPILCLVADHEFLGNDAAWLRGITRVAAAVRSLRVGAPALPAPPAATAPSLIMQLRAKQARGDQRELLLARALHAARDAGIPVLLNGSTDEARRWGFDGVHWPEAALLGAAAAPAPDDTGAGALPGTPVRRRFLRSAAVHSAEATARAAAAGADFVVFGPVFAPGSKAGSGVGLRALARIATCASVPVLAIGGVTAESAPDCLAAGASGVAVVSAAFSPGLDAQTAVGELIGALSTAARDSAS